MQTAGNVQLAAVPGATVVSRTSWDTIHLSTMSLHRHHIRPPLNALGKVFRLPFLAPEPGIAFATYNNFCPLLAVRTLQKLQRLPCVAL